MGKKQKEVKERESLMLRNGSMLLEELISFCNGKCNPIRSFSAKQLLEATNNFQSPLYKVNDRWYRASLNNHSVLIKIHGPPTFAERTCQDIAITSQMSNHGRVLKLLGCCLEFPTPTMVYEDAEYGPLNRCGGVVPDDDSCDDDGTINGSSLSWNTRLKTAKDIANALTYLHTAFSRPIVHCNVNPSKVFLTNNLVAKLSDFSLSVSIPEGKKGVHLDDLWGTPGFTDPELLSTSFVTEKSDVYSFGVFLLVLLTGKAAIDRHKLYLNLTEFVKENPWDEIVDPKVLEEEAAGINEERKLKLHLEVQAFLNLAKRCTQIKGEDRPVMIDVAKELAQIQISTAA
ncbi:hypothetical protein FEM48_Zijuj08G0175700 [Ziziphus jujuba var. spinosa]|uniref:Protein kinase domain-containing protein n=1 Tax=Ziziphus jujuba var. spinosa TaxID=714518 RepID=A0A978V0F8_ZIZJJ|nr:hypothetical protein FEM48_Zijuj08G0175700 [Ziziphus jujuba var. spinosa]